MAETKGKVLSTVILCVLFSFVIKAQNTIDETNEAVLNEDFGVVLKWRVDGDDIFFEMSATTQGYVAIGFSPNGGMPGSDIVAGWVKDGEPFLSDRHATAEAKPDADLSDDYELLYGNEENGKTTIGFKRKLQTCDTNDYAITGDTARIIWALNANDPANSDDLMYHSTTRGVRSVVLLDAASSVGGELPPDAEFFERVMPNVNIPSNDTTYWCTLFTMPEFEKPVHVFQIDTIVQEGHEGLVHHMLLYGCSGNLSSVVWSDSCQKTNQPPELSTCRHLLYAWGIGGGSFEFPEHVGLSLGGDDDPKFFKIELHYDNPELRADFVDSSGVRMHYTPTLRQYDAGVWMIGEGISSKHMIPPNETDFETFGFCLGDCTKEHISEDLNVFGTFHHAHLAGRQVSLQQYRDGKLIDDIRDDNYDFNYQETRVVMPERIFKAGDDYVVTCSYNTEGREGITFGGDKSTEEMCLSFLYYYPKQSSLTFCLSSPTDSSFSEAFGLEDLYTNAGRGGVDLVSIIPQFSSEEVKTGLTEVSYSGKREGICFSSGDGQSSLAPMAFDFPEWFNPEQRIQQDDQCASASITGGCKTMRAGYWSILAVFAIVMCL